MQCPPKPGPGRKAINPKGFVAAASMTASEESNKTLLSEIVDMRELHDKALAEQLGLQDELHALEAARDIALDLSRESEARLVKHDENVRRIVQVYDEEFEALRSARNSSRESAAAAASMARGEIDALTLQGGSLEESLASATRDLKSALSSSESDKEAAVNLANKLRRTGKFH